MTHLNLFAILTSMFSIGCQTPKNSQSAQGYLHEVKGNLTFTYDYCGGARPSDEMLAKLKEPRVIEGFTVYLKPGKENSTAAITDSAQCDSNGNYVFRIPKGDYVILMPAQVKEYDLKISITSFLRLLTNPALSNGGKKVWQHYT
ncbi:MAG: hypothetical protein IPO27_04590 [Bacteroidetes bacterium]|nr:hypothetical protein [Bacteroidota bacterium]